LGTASGASIGADTVTNFEAVVGTAFNDTLTGDSGDNALSGGAGADAIGGGDGDDTISGGAGDDGLDGGGGFDTVDFSSAAAGINVNFDSGVGTDGDGGTDTFFGFEAVVGSAFDDQINTGDVLDTVFAGAGDDLVTHSPFVSGARVSGGTGNDTMFATIGVDRFIFETGDGVDNITGFGTTAGFEDVLDFSGDDSIESVADLTISDAGGSALIQYGAGDSVTLLGVNVNNLDEDSFQF
jgi:Ca2+-binding RTX toxin-like protein